ncbi:hypothetical protein NUH86_11425 [Sphingobium sp. JS3065]|uniref:hypothetical protein n=1 Tax=Sphingobium sp. JS3065 TaxID=2970925 RepID=UPI002264BB62|nr:hypothetical protein [Sphingobium sp. JS3065]UZW54139.1 hypothetical protein NUH86_11425 [Sphingobium sp. JS3065]
MNAIDMTIGKPGYEVVISTLPVGYAIFTHETQFQRAIIFIGASHSFIKFIIFRRYFAIGRPAFQRSQHQHDLQISDSRRFDFIGLPALCLPRRRSTAKKERDETTGGTRRHPQPRHDGPRRIGWTPQIEY